MTYPEKHIRQTKKLISKIGAKNIADWIVTDGYFPEQFVLPPCFKVNKFKLNKTPYYPKTGSSLKPPITQSISIFLQKSHLTDRSFTIIDPKIYHDICLYVKKDWKLILNTLFHKDNKIHAYSFPIPITSKVDSHLGKLRGGRMIYEYIEMAENDLVAEAHNYNFILKTDIKNFYPSVYTHSISWALHGKDNARADRFKYNLTGNKIDKLFQNANDGCTNGIGIGSALTDLISEIILAAVDTELSKLIKKKKIKFLGVRFKDDYRFLCKTKGDGEFIIKSLQSELRKYNLNLSENKSDIGELPEGLYRNWISEYSKHTLRYRKTISFRQFEKTYLAVLRLHKNHPDTGIIDRFVSELSSKSHNLKLVITGKEINKTISLLLLLKAKRPKCFPQILAIIESLYQANKADKAISSFIKRAIQDLFKEQIKNPTDNIFILVWLSYFIRTNSLFKINWPKKIDNPLLKSIKENKQCYFSYPDIELFTKIKTKPDITLLKHLTLFPKD